MSFFDDEKNVDEYIKMAEGYDGSLLIDVLKRQAAPGASVLELGMGPGKDLALLSEAGFRPTGSDSSKVFVDRYRAGPGKFPVHQLDARILDIDETFDVIYSNKVLHSLTEDELSQSFQRQRALLNPGGLLLHSFWIGEGNEVFSGMFAQYYRRDTLSARLPKPLVIDQFETYQEMEPGDSFWVALRAR